MRIKRIKPKLKPPKKLQDFHLQTEEDRKYVDDLINGKIILGGG